MTFRTLVIAMLGASLAATLSLAYAQARPAGESSSGAMAAPTNEPRAAARTDRTRLAYADARVCLDFPSNPQVIACAEKYRPDRAR
jgi:hypothetical protein